VVLLPSVNEQWSSWYVSWLRLMLSYDMHRLLVPFIVDQGMDWQSGSRALFSDDRKGRSEFSLC